MNLQITTPDPFKILASTKAVVESAKFITLNEQAIEQTSGRIGQYLKEHADFPDHGHRLTGDYQTDVNLVFFESMMGFCFWALPGKDKWAVKMPDGEVVDGWYGVAAAFKRAADAGMPVADAKFLANASESDIRNIFHSATAAEIPLLSDRIRILNGNARVLRNHFGGQAINLVEAADYDVVKLFELLLEYFPSYRDVATHNGREVVFLKIAHLLALDLEYRLAPIAKRPFLKNFNQLSVFADYKLPQLLRMFVILQYTDDLAHMVDSYTEVPAGSAEEIEIRSGAIWGVELLCQQLPAYSAIQVGHVIWLTSQDQSLQSQINPYHRTYTIFY